MESQTQYKLKRTAYYLQRQYPFCLYQDTY